MRWNNVRNVAVVLRNAFLLLGGSTTLACSWVAPPAPTGAFTVNPTSLTFANLQAPAQQLTVTGTLGATSAGGPESSCFTLGPISKSGSNQVFPVSPASNQLGACALYLARGESSILVPVVIAVQTSIGTPVSYEAAFIASSSAPVTLKSSNANVASVPATATPVTSGQLQYVPFTITPNANGTAVIQVIEGNASGPATFSIPVTVGTSTPTPSPSASPSAAPTASPTAAPTAGPTAAPTASPTAAPTASPTAAPTPTPTATPVTGNSFVLTNASTQSFGLVASPVAATISFFGQVTIAGATSEVVPYSEEVGVPSDGCAITGTMVDAITLTFPTAFTFVPNGSDGPTTGLLDTEFTPSSGIATGYGAIYQAGSCTTPFSPQTELFASPTTYEYVGGGNTTIPAGTYIVELWQ